MKITISKQSLINEQHRRKHNLESKLVTTLSNKEIVAELNSKLPTSATTPEVSVEDYLRIHKEAYDKGYEQGYSHGNRWGVDYAINTINTINEMDGCGTSYRIVKPQIRPRDSKGRFVKQENK